VQDAEFFDIRNSVGQRLRHQALLLALDDLEAWLELGACSLLCICACMCVRVHGMCVCVRALVGSG
jgi:hypothetical protein